MLLMFHILHLGAFQKDVIQKGIFNSAIYSLLASVFQMSIVLSCPAILYFFSTYLELSLSVCV